MRIPHLSDTHIDHAGAPNRNGVDPAASLRGMLTDVRHLAGLSAVVVSGDLADSGAPEEYAVVRDLVGGFARERGIPVFCTTGNHDERGVFAKALGSGHLDPAGGDRAEDQLGSPTASWSGFTPATPGPARRSFVDVGTSEAHQLQPGPQRPH